MARSDYPPKSGIVRREPVAEPFNVDVTLLRSRDVVVGAGGRSSKRGILLWLCLGVVLVRSVYVAQPLRSDEGGYLMVARQWHAGGEFVYGDYYVDRPPLLMAIFRVAALSDWDPMIRVLAIPFTLLFVVAAWHAGRLLAGLRSARWAAVVGAALMCSPALAADQADGELFAAPLVMAAFALALAAWKADSGRARLWLALAAGVFAGAAPLVKQNFLEGLVFIAVLTTVAALSLRRVGPREMTVALGGLAGAVVPHAVVWVWAVSRGIEPVTIWEDLVAFRGRAFDVLWSNSPQASVDRGIRLLLLGVVSGVLLVVLAWFAASRPSRRRVGPAHWAITACLMFGLVSITGGGSYWPHYLVELAPVTALAAGVVAPQVTRAGRWMRGAARTVVAAAALGTVLMAALYAASPWMWFQQHAGEWLAASSAPGDTAFVAYGNASVLEAADMQSPYPYLWSLPMRTLDPDLSRLRATLAGPEAPSWIVQLNALDSWGIDSDSRLQNLVEERYRLIGEVCGHPVWLRADLRRRTAPAPRC